MSIVRCARKTSGLPSADQNLLAGLYQHTSPEPSSPAAADELAGAAELVMGKTERIPVILIRGYRYGKGEGRASMLVRPSERDLFG